MHQDRTISIITPCYNEEENVEELYTRVRNAMAQVGRYRYEHIFIDNASEDATVEILKQIAARDSNVKVIVNARNFGHIRSPMHALFQTTGDAVIGIVADLQDPPEMIADLIAKWEEGFPIVLCIKNVSDENKLMYWVRTKYYQLVNRLSTIKTFENFTGYGLYDRRVVDIIKQIDDPYPYFRGLIADIGLPYAEIYFRQPRRIRGLTKNNFYTLWDIGMLGITSLSKVPLRIVVFTGFVAAGISMLTGIGYFIYKLLFWNNFSVGIAPLVIGLSLFSSIQLISLGILGEYVGAIYTHVQKRPYVIEKERVNFEYGPGTPGGGQS
jgi:glycosyltransferase involved in cell wall biosynthesis